MIAHLIYLSAVCGTRQTFLPELLGYGVPSSSVRISQQLKPQFQVSGEICVGSLVNDQHRSQHVMRMFVRRGDRFYLVRDLGDLRGIVHITKPEDALEFVRLRTLPLASPILDERILEVVPRGSVSSVLTFGSSSAATAMAKATDGRWGVVSDGMFERMHLGRPTVLRNGNSFVVSRWLVAAVCDFNVLIRVRETVNEDGKYSMQTDERRIWESTGFDWLFPSNAAP